MKKQLRRRGLFYILFLLLFVVSPQIILGQEYPTKPVTLWVPFAPGGESDLIGRALASVAVDYLGQPILIQLKPGGQGIIGTDLVAKAPPDGYTLLSAGSGWNSALPAIEGRSKGPDDMEAICRINYSSVLMCARADAPFKTFKELMAWIKANPGKLLVGYGGPYAPMQMFWTQMMKQTGISIRSLILDGGGQMVIAALGGNVDVCGGTPQMLLSHVRAKKLIPLVYLDKVRTPEFPDLLTIVEEGINITALQWRGITAPKGTPRPIIDKLGVAFKKMTDDESLKSLMQKTGLTIQYQGPDEFAAFWRTDYEFHKGLKDFIRR